MTNTSLLEFWESIDKALALIEDAKPDTFDGVRDILHAYGDPDRESMTPTPNRAFFGGSGGDATLIEALWSAGWHVVWSEATYFYTVEHPNTGERLTYIEGDVMRGDR